MSTADACNDQIRSLRHLRPFETNAASRRVAPIHMRPSKADTPCVSALYGSLPFRARGHTARATVIPPQRNHRASCSTRTRRSLGACRSRAVKNQGAAHNCALPRLETYGLEHPASTPANCNFVGPALTRASDTESHTDASRVKRCRLQSCLSPYPF